MSSCSKCVTTKTTMPVISDVVAATGQVRGGARQTLHASSEQQNVHADMADVVRPSWQSADVSFSWRPHDAFIVQILLIDSFSLSSVCIYYSRIQHIASHTANGRRRFGLYTVPQSKLSPRGDKTICPRRRQFDSRWIYVRPRTGPQSVHLWCRPAVRG